MKFRSLRRLGDHYLDMASDEAISAFVSGAFAKIAAVARFQRKTGRAPGNLTPNVTPCPRSGAV
ncbi:MAG TPA: hypothetical protein PLD46_01130 [Hyphomicrobium sp.]|nr:hypothetical protein [Hyphomicrobium sp.]